ncbi:MAG: hypothetical protein AAF585_07750 [Verrucomicrobiota bacterium]
MERNREIAKAAEEWAKRHSTKRLSFFIQHHPQLPKKHAGVGLARKIGMDEGCRRLVSVDNEDGVLICFDADSRCDPNYLVEIEALFRENDFCDACSIYFEHPLDGEEHPPEIYDAITLYELHLRYFVHAQRWAGFPLAIQTIGSSMAARCRGYQEQNGMNRRKAGEDFYFLHKFTSLLSVANLNTTRVIPSPRISGRVPFGTGKAVGDWIAADESRYLTYSPESFQDLRQFLNHVGDLFTKYPPPDLPPSIRTFLEHRGFEAHLAEIRRNVSNPGAFVTRFFRWFNAFEVMKFVHHSRDHYHPNCDVAKAAAWLLGMNSATPRQLLEELRKRDRTGQVCDPNRP